LIINTSKIDIFKQQLLKDNANQKTELCKQEYKLLKKNYIGTLNSASYKLGHLLLHEIKSFSDILSFPRKIWMIRKESVLDSSPKKIEKIDIDFLVNKKHNRTKTYDFLSDIDKLKIACVMDEFTYRVFAPEADFQQLTPASWKSEIKKIKPDLLFVESAWRGENDLWTGKIRHLSQELVDLIGYCRQQHIPTLFWNKEDPIHFDDFIDTAQYFDFIFTTDIGRIKAYKKRLGNDNVYLMPFSCQPKIHNPIEEYKRKNAIVFAGAYYQHFSKRMKLLENFMIHLISFVDIDIYDRNYEDVDTPHKFPKAYKPFIRGKLAYDEIDQAYKGYKYAINLNSITDSSTMFSRRIFELLASNTVVVSNFSVGVQTLFGDLVISTDDGVELAEKLQNCMKDELKTKKIKLLALRKVMLEHTAEVRMHYLISKVFAHHIGMTLPHITVVGYASAKEELTQLLDSYERQIYQNKNLVIIVSQSIDVNHVSLDGITVIYEEDAFHKSVSDFSSSSSYISGMVSEDHYGKNYLMDLALATCYSDSKIIGKASYYYRGEEEQKLTLLNADLSYCIVNNMSARSCMIAKSRVGAQDIISWSKQLLTLCYDERMLSIDEFNYCQNASSKNLTEKERYVICDLETIDSGICLENWLQDALETE